MGNIKSAKKNVLAIEKKIMKDKALKAALEAQIENILASIDERDKELNANLFRETVFTISVAASKNLACKNNANSANLCKRKIDLKRAGVITIVVKQYV